MSFANFGIGLGAFSQGFMGGAKMGQMAREAKDGRDIRRQAKQGIESAREAREGDINARIGQQGLDGAQGFMGEMTTGYEVDGKQFGSPEAARGQAERGQGSVMDYFMRDAAPKIGETFLAQGNIEKAEAWNQWISDSQTRRGMEHWSRALRAAQMGDNKGFVDAITQAYNSPGYADDGLTVKSHRINDGGSITMIFERDGEEFEQTFENTEDLQQMAIGLLSPNNAFEITRAQAQSAAEARSKAAQEDLKFQRELYRDEAKHGQSLEQDTHRSNLRQMENTEGLRQKANEAAGVLRDWGYSDSEISAMIPRIIGSDSSRQQISDRDLRLRIVESFSGDRRFGSLTPEQQEQRISEMVELVRGADDDAPRTPNPAAGGLPGQPTWDSMN